MSSGAEKRSSVRRSFNKPVSIEVSAAESEEVKTGLRGSVCLDVSVGGLGLTADLPLKKGQILKVFLPIQKAGTRLPVFGEVVWSATSDEHACRAGLRILH